LATIWGTDVSGTTFVPTTSTNAIALTDCSFNIIGGSISAERNLISAGHYAIDISGTAHHNHVLGNYIGLMPVA